MKTRWIPGVLLFGTLNAWAGQSATTLDQTALMGAPGGKTVSTLAKGVVLDVGERSGGYYQVTLVDGRKGWVRMSNIRFKEESDSGSVFGGFWSWLNSGSSRTSSGTTTAGIRGAQTSDFLNAKYEGSTSSVDELAAFQVDAATARKFAAAGSLKTHDIDRLED